MAGLSISRAWDETKARIAADGRLYVATALALLVLPSTIFGAFAPASPNEIDAAFYVLLIVWMMTALIGQIALSRLAMPPTLTVGGAIQRGARRLLPAFLALIVVFVAIGIVFVIIGVTLAVAGVVSMPGDGAPPPLSLMLLLGLALVLIYAIFQLVIPVASAEAGGPIHLIGRSWELAKRSYLRLVAFLAIVFVGMFVIWLSSQSVAGLIVSAVSGPPEPGSIGMILVSLFVALAQACWTIVTALMLARIYLQLAGDDVETVSVPSSGT